MGKGRILSVIFTTTISSLSISRQSETVESSWVRHISKPGPSIEVSGLLLTLNSNYGLFDNAKLWFCPAFIMIIFNDSYCIFTSIFSGIHGLINSAYYVIPAI